MEEPYYAGEVKEAIGLVEFSIVGPAHTMGYLLQGQRTERSSLYILNSEAHYIHHILTSKSEVLLRVSLTETLTSNIALLLRKLLASPNFTTFRPYTVCCNTLALPEYSSKDIQEGHPGRKIQV